MWQEIKVNAPEEFKDAVDIDAIIRSGGTNRRESQFMHRELKPLNEITFINDKQLDMFTNECDGYCAT
jgi:hypothetical protein